MKYRFLDNLNESQIKGLENVLLGITSNEEMLNEIQLLKNKKYSINGYDFDSSYIPNYDEELEKRCLEILSKIKINDLFFFLASFKNKANTRYLRPTASFYSDVFDEFTYEDLITLIGLTWNVYRCYDNSDMLKPDLYLNKVNSMFQNHKFCKDYEGPYNMFNYIKNYIYLLLAQDKKIDTKDIFDSYQEKRKLVTIKFKDISSYLYEIRNGTNLRLCISNAGLSRNVTKVGDTLTFSQEVFRDALAFGTTLDNIEKGNYEDYKKLLYLPSGKKIIK